MRSEFKTFYQGTRAASRSPSIPCRPFVNTTTYTRITSNKHRILERRQFKKIFKNPGVLRRRRSFHVATNAALFIFRSSSSPLLSLSCVESTSRFSNTRHLTDFRLWILVFHVLSTSSRPSRDRYRTLNSDCRRNPESFCTSPGFAHEH